MVMDDDEDVLIEGGVLLTYLNENGIAVSDFETIQPVRKKNDSIKSYGDTGPQEQVPFWVQRHVNIILKSGLIFDDHNHFVESFLPAVVTGDISKWRTYFLAATSWVGVMCSSPFLFRNIRNPAIGAVTVTCLSIPIAVYSTCLLYGQRETTTSLNFLQDAICTLEKLFTQLKKCTLIIQEADAVLSKFKLPGIELQQFRKIVRLYLKDVIYCLSDLTAKLTEVVPLDGKVDSTAYCISKEEIEAATLDDNHEDATSAGTLKRIFNIYLLVQSELLRRLALCYCPEMWLPGTKGLLRHLSSIYRSIAQWASGVHRKLDKAVKIYEAFGGTYEKKAKIKGTPMVMGIRSDLYITMRSSSLHLQSVLARSRELEDSLEMSFPEDKSENIVFLESLHVAIKDMQKDLRTSQVFLEDALVHVLKTKNALEEVPCAEEDEKGEENEPSNATQILQEVEPNPPVEDDVFEAVIKRDVEEDVRHEEDNMTLQEEKEMKEREKQKSLRVLSELKVVLKEKASEWKERERKARERKGCAVDGNHSDSAEENLEFLPTGNQRSWPLPRLKSSILNPRKKTVCRVSTVEKSDDGTVAEGKQDARESFIPGSAFSPGLLAEAMQKSLAFVKKREEDCFGDSGGDSD